MPFGTTGRKWQNRVQTINRLDRALLVHTEHSGMHGCVSILLMQEKLGLAENGFLAQLKVNVLS
jgi:hypothetical protein